MIQHKQIRINKELDSKKDSLGTMQQILVLAPNLLIAIHYGGGGEIHLARLSTHLIQKGFDVVVTVNKRGWHLPINERLQIDHNELHLQTILFLPIRFIGTSIIILQMFIYLVFMIAKPRIIILYSAKPNMVVMGTIARLLGHKTIIYTIGEDLRIMQARRSGLIARAHRFLVNCQNFVIPLSNDMKRCLQNQGIIDKKIVLIPNGVDTEKFRPVKDKSKRQSLRTGLDLPTDYWIIAIVARLYPIKRQDILLRAFALIQNEQPNTKLLLIGDGPERDQLVSLAKELFIENNVIFAGHRSNTQEYLQAVDAFVLSSDAEGHSNALIEAMASGLPIVATDVGGNSDCIQHEQNGLLVPRRDSRALAEAFLRLIRNPQFATQLAHKARETAEDRYSFSVEVAAYQDLFQRLAKDKHVNLSDS